jgi:hypothetical protein
MNRRRLSAVAIGGCLSLLCGAAYGQASIETTRLVEGAESIVEGPGIPLGEGTVLHPIVGVETGFTDNVFYTESSTRSSGVLRLLVEAALASKALKPEVAGETYIDGEEPPAEAADQALVYRLGARLSYTQYLTGTDAISDQGGLGALATGHLEALPAGKLTFVADETFLRDIRPTNYFGFQHSNRIINASNLGLRWRPGGGAMQGSLRWDNQIDYFEDDKQRFANRMINAIVVGYEWKLFPYTKLFADFNYSFVGSFGADGGAIPAIKRDAQPIRGGVGIATALSEMVTAKAHAGWAYASYDGGSGYNTPVFGAELGYRYSPLGRVLVGYNWDHRDSINADYYRDHQIHAGIEQPIGPVLGNLGGEVRIRKYNGISPDIGPPERDDVILAGALRGTYVYRDWLAILLEVRIQSVQTDYMPVVSAPFSDPSFTRTDATLGMRAAF